MTDSYDVVVLGAGPTGENVADRAVKGGLSAVVVESELVGGECSYWACIPSKALLRPVALASMSGKVRGVTGTRLDPPQVLARRDDFSSHWKDDGQVSWLSGANIELIRGSGMITSARSVKIGPRNIRARHAVVVATGTRARIPDELAAVGAWDSRDATSAKAAPARLAIVGGGVVGCEMAAAWQALGSQVTLLARRRLLDRNEDFAGDLVADGLRAAGADVRLGVGVASASRADEGGPVRLTLSDGGTLEADEVLAATGRAPQTDHIGLDSVGLTPGSWLDVDDTMLVRGVDHDGPGWLYAAGDVNHRALLTHMGKYQGRICGDAIVARAAGNQPTVFATGPVPQAIFTEPEVAAVGMTAAQAQATGMRVRVVDYDLGQVAGANLYADGYAGRARMVVDSERRVIVGMTLVGSGVGEMIHAATVAIAGAVPLDRLWHAVPSYPTISEVFLRLLEEYGM